MCGIYGRFHFHNTVNFSKNLESLDLIKHRGPDGFGFEIGNYLTGQRSVQHNHIPENVDSYNESNYFLGHRRLSIVDLNDNAFQPMESNCNRYSVIFNGEIYNYIELKQELEELGCSFATDHSDTEVLLNAYKTWGNHCVSKFRGMFAFAIYDRDSHTVFLGRDRIGQKTLYYELTKDLFCFASELPPIINEHSKAQIDPIALNLYVAMGYIPHPHSIFKGIQKLPPATTALVNLTDRTINLEEYWELSDFGSLSGSPEAALKLTKETLQKSVTLRLRSDVSVGAFISGGTDSTLIVKNIAEISDEKFDVYGADFPDTDRSEKVYIEQAAEKYQQNLKLSSIDLSHIDKIESIIDVFDEPFDGASSIALFDLFKVATNDHKVILSGDGGDEMFAGYDRYLESPKREAKLDFLRKLSFPKLVLNTLYKLKLLPNKLATKRLELLADSIDNFTGLAQLELTSAILKDEYKICSKLEKLEPFASIKESLSKKQPSPLKSLQYVELKSILPGRMLYKLDRFSMFYGVEARSPFLDHVLAEMAFSLDDSLTLEDNTPKAILKKILLEDFDSNFVYREKQGFGNPLSNWFRSSENRQVFDILTNKKSSIFNYLDYDNTHAAYPQLKNGYSGHGEKSLWRLLVLAHFIEKHKSLLQIDDSEQQGN